MQLYLQTAMISGQVLSHNCIVRAWYKLVIAITRFSAPYMIYTALAEAVLPFLYSSQAQDMVK